MTSLIKLAEAQDTLKIKDVRRVFRQYGHPIDKRTAERVWLALPTASLATAWSRMELLNNIAPQGAEGVERLFVIVRGMMIDDV